MVLKYKVLKFLKVYLKNRSKNAKSNKDLYFFKKYHNLKALLQYILIIIILTSSSFASSQEHFFLNKEVSEKIKFELIGNLIVIPIEINGFNLSFILDSGVSVPILFNVSDSDSLDLKNIEKFFFTRLRRQW